MILNTRIVTTYFDAINPKKLDDLESRLLLEVFSDPAVARQLLERFRWPMGPCCPHCGSRKSHYPIRPKEDSLNPARPGLLGCKSCRKQFTVTVGTPLERTKVPLALWMVALLWIFSERKGSVYALNKGTKELGVTYKTTKSIVAKVRDARSDVRRRSNSKSLSADPTFGDIVRLFLSIRKKKRAKGLSEWRDWRAKIRCFDGTHWKEPPSLEVCAQSLSAAYRRAERDYYKRYLGGSDSGLKEVIITLTAI